MHIKDQRIANIKQKYGPKFKPIMFAVEAAHPEGVVGSATSLPRDEALHRGASATATGPPSGCRSLSTALTG
jgi:hypothetical protein